MCKEAGEKPASVSSSVSTSEAKTMSKETLGEGKPSAPTVRTGVLLGSLSLFISVLGASLTFPFLQSQRDKLSCDALCYGSMQSTRSALTMIGTVIVGRLSDKLGRKVVLLVGTSSSIVSYLLGLHGNSLTMLWLALIPGALLNHNFSVLKALFADYSSEYGFSEAERAASMGRLGMSVGLSFMLGPLLATNILSSYDEALVAAIFLSCVSAALVFFLPQLPSASQDLYSNKRVGSTYSTDCLVQMDMDTNTTNTNTVSSNNNFKDKESEGKEKEKEKEEEEENSLQKNKEINTSNNTQASKKSSKNIQSSFLDLFYLPVMQSSGAKLLMFMRFFMALAYNIFITVWTVSLKSRFNFGPKDHAFFMGWIGLWYALSQGVLANLMIKTMKSDDPTKLLLACIVGLSFGRVVVMYTADLNVVYAVMAIVIVCLGVMNTAMAAACSHLAGEDQVGGLYGLMESIEGLGGLVGPTLGGVLYTMNTKIPLFAVVGIYGVVLVAVLLYYKECVVDSHYKNGVAGPIVTTTTATTVEKEKKLQ